MDLMNTDSLKLGTELMLGSVSCLTQDPKLVDAIENLCHRHEKSRQNMELPERKLEFNEIHNLLKQSPDSKGIYFDKFLFT